MARIAIESGQMTHFIMKTPGALLSATELLRRASAGDDVALGSLLDSHRSTLRRMISLRMDPRIQGRVDPSDVIQDTFIKAAQRFPEYVDQDVMPFYLWLRNLAIQRLVDHYRQHIGAQSRAVSRELRLNGGSQLDATSGALSKQLLGRATTPCAAAIRAEQRVQLQEALEQLDPVDREILTLRHLEQLSNGEAALATGLDKSAASKRYARALVRLKELLKTRS